MYIYLTYLISCPLYVCLSLECQPLIAYQNLHEICLMFLCQTLLAFFQILAVYDRFGRLLHGNPIVAKDTLEYVVFEKHLSNVYGKWRIHAKIIPDWVEKKSVSKRTYVIIEEQQKDKKEENRNEQQVAKDGLQEEGKEFVEEEGTVHDRFGKAISKQ